MQLIFLRNIINRPVWIVTRRTKIGTETTESVICAQATFAGATTAVSQSTAANRLEPAVYEFLLNGSPGSSVFVVIDRQHTKNGKDYVDKVVGAYNSLSEALQMTKNSIYVIHKLVNAPERNFQDQGTMELGGGCIFLVEEYPISKSE